MKNTKDKVKGVLKKIARLPGKAVDRFEGKIKGVAEARQSRNTQMIENNFGSVDNYNQIQKGVKPLQKRALQRAIKPN